MEFNTEAPNIVNNLKVLIKIERDTNKLLSLLVKYSERKAKLVYDMALDSATKNLNPLKPGVWERLVIPRCRTSNCYLEVGSL